MQLISKNKTTLGNTFNFKDSISKDPTSGVACNLQCGLSNEYYYGKYMRYFNLTIGEPGLYYHLPKSKLSLKIAPNAIINYFETITCPMIMIMVSWYLVIRTEREHAN